MMRNKEVRDIEDHKDRKHVLDVSSSLPLSLFISLASFLLVTAAEWPQKAVDS